MEQASEGSAYADEDQQPEDMSDGTRQKPGWVHQGVKQQDIRNQWREKSQGQRQKPVEEQQHAGDDLDAEDQHKIMRSSQGRHVMNGEWRGRRRLREMKCRNPFRPKTENMIPSR